MWKRLRFRPKTFLILLTAVVFTGILTGFTFRRLEYPFSSAFSGYASRVGNEAINNAVSECMKDEIGYKDLINITKNADGEITSMSADGMKISALKSKLTQYIQSYIIDYPKQELSLPVGSAEGSTIFSAFGPRVKIKIYPSSVTSMDFRDEFTDAGINQVRHTIYLDVSINVTIRTATMNKTQNVISSVLIADTVIVGKVPNYYGGMHMLTTEEVNDEKANRGVN